MIFMLLVSVTIQKVVTSIYNYLIIVSILYSLCLHYEPYLVVVPSLDDINLYS